MTPSKNHRTLLGLLDISDSAPKQKLLDAAQDWICVLGHIHLEYLSEYEDEAIILLLDAARLKLQVARAMRAMILLCHIRYKSPLDPSRRSDVLKRKTQVQALEAEAQKRLVTASKRVKALKAALRA